MGGKINLTYKMLLEKKYLRAKYLKICTVQSVLRFYQQIIYIYTYIKYQL